MVVFTHAGVLCGAAAHRRRWVAVRSLVAWRGPEKKQAKQDLPRPHARCPRGHRRHPGPSQAPQQARSQGASGWPLVPPDHPVRAGGVGAHSGVPGRHGRHGLGPRWGWCRMRARAGAHAPTEGQRRVPITESTGAGWSGGAPSCAGGGAACPGMRGGGRLWQAVTVGDAVRAVAQQRPGHSERAPAAGWSCRAGGAERGAPGAVAVSATVSPDPLAVHAWVAAVGLREAWAPRPVPSHPTRACRRRPTASARASLRLLGAPEAQR